MSVVALIMAAGKGNRVGGNIPKQYMTISRQTVLTRTISKLLESKLINYVQVVINKDDISLYNDSITEFKTKRLLTPCIGGSERSDSARLGLIHLQDFNPEKVIIHDAARPFVSLELINKVVNSLNKSSAVLPALPVVDALWQKAETSNSVRIKPGPNRDGLLRAQTPQGFDYKKILSAHLKNKEKTFDDIAIAYKQGIKIDIIMGEEENFKLTTTNDFKRAERFI